MSLRDRIATRWRRMITRVPILPWPLALVLVLALHGVSLWLLPRLHLNNSPEVYYPAQSAAVALRDELRKEFPSDEMLTVVFVGDDLYSRAFLDRLDTLAQAVSRHPLVDRVTTVTTLERISGSEEGFTVEPLVGAATRASASAEQIRERVLSDRFAPGLLASRDGKLLAMAVRPKQLSESADRLALKVAVAAAINESGLRPYYAGDAGPVTIDVAQLQSVMQDTLFFVPLTVALGLLLLWWVVGRLRPVVIGGVAMSCVVMPVIAGIAVSGQPYTMATAILPSLLAAYTLATLLHLYAAVQKAQAGGAHRTEAVRRALDETVAPGAFNVLTTSAGLLSLVFVPMPPIQVFGIAGALGTALVFLTVYLLVPALLSSWDHRRWPSRGSGMGHFSRIAGKAPLLAMRRPWMVLGAAVVVVGAALPLALRVQAESNALDFFAADHEVNRHNTLIERKLAGTMSLEISVKAGERDALQRVQALQALRAFQDWLESLPEVDRTASMVDLVEEMHWAMNDEKPSFRAIPDNDRLLAQYLLVYDGKDLYELVNRDFQHARVMVNLNVHGAREIDRVITAVAERLKTHPLPGMSVDAGGYGRLFADQVALLVEGQTNSFAGAFVQIAIFMALLWRSLRASLLCLVPNLAPLFFIFVLMGASGIHLDLATVMIAGVVLGITVDDTIHLYYGYRERRRRGISPALAVARSFQSSGRAVLAISLLLTAQFGLLATSDFVPTSNFGLMTAVGLLAGQAAEILLMPALLLVAANVSARGWRGLIPPVRKPRTAELPAATEWQPTVLVPHVPLEPPTPLTGDQGEAPRTGPQRPQVPALEARTSAVDASGRDGTPATPAATPLLLVCTGDACRARGADAVWAAAQRARDDQLAADLALAARPVESGCLGRCDAAPALALVAELEAPLVVAESGAERARVLVTGRPDPG